MSKMFIAGLNHLSGTSKAGNAFSMPRATILSPIESRDNGNIRNVGFGYGAGEMACSPEAVEQARSLKFPNFYEVEIETTLRNGEYEPVLKGFRA